mmetsp:Transcript_4222/g.4646  ORF Transcript_4222/g.4646 Transcript_4222/m.4646 type:complete len:234 (-) Transcript_4222:571-1272(-)
MPVERRLYSFSVATEKEEDCAELRNNPLFRDFKSSLGALAETLEKRRLENFFNDPVTVPALLSVTVVSVDCFPPGLPNVVGWLLTSSFGVTMTKPRLSSSILFRSCSKKSFASLSFGSTSVPGTDKSWSLFASTCSGEIGGRKRLRIESPKLTKFGNQIVMFVIIDCIVRISLSFSMISSSYCLSVACSSVSFDEFFASNSRWNFPCSATYLSSQVFAAMVFSASFTVSSSID